MFIASSKSMFRRRQQTAMNLLLLLAVDPKNIYLSSSFSSSFIAMSYHCHYDRVLRMMMKPRLPRQTQHKRSLVPFSLFINPPPSSSCRVLLSSSSSWSLLNSSRNNNHHQQQQQTMTTTTIMEKTSRHEEEEKKKDIFIEKVHQSLENHIFLPLFTKWNPTIIMDNPTTTVTPTTDPNTIITTPTTTTPTPTTIILLLAVSGGADSMALFHSIQSFMTSSSSSSSSPSSSLFPWWKDDSRYTIQLHVVHFNHQQRNIESTLDQYHVQAICNQFQIPCWTFYWNNDNNNNNNKKKKKMDSSQKNKQSTTTTTTTSSSSLFTQNKARQWRYHTCYTLLQELITSYNHHHYQNTTTTTTTTNNNCYGILCTAHHKDDDEETILLKLLRGVHISQISGMKKSLIPFDLYKEEEEELEEEEGEEVESIKQVVDDHLEEVHKKKNDTTTTTTTLEGIQQPNNLTRTTTITTPNTSSSSSSSSSFLLFITKPLLSIRKDEIIQYLTRHGYKWREDASNTSNKYLRNRVRNELIPLLQDLVGHTHILERRFDCIQQQSMKIQQSLDKQAMEYFALFQTKNTTTATAAGDTSSSSSTIIKANSINDWMIPLVFPLKSSYNLISSPSSSLSTITTNTFTSNWNAGEEHALYLWLRYTSKNRLFVSYDKLVRICHQVSQYPKRTHWTIELGSGWNVIRKGKILLLEKKENVQYKNTEK